MVQVDIMSFEGRKSIFKTAVRILTLTLITTLFVGTPDAFAAAPVISTSSTISNGALDPTLTLVGVNFATDNDKFDFTVDVGETDLKYDSVAFVSSTQMRFRFSGRTRAGSITIQADPSSFYPVAAEPSKILTIIVPAAPISQIITFNTPMTMTVKDLDQTPTATSNSGLTVSFLSNTPSVCTIDFLKIHAVAAGICSIKASQAGDMIFAPATDVIKTLVVLAAQPKSPDASISPIAGTIDLGTVTYNPNAASDKYVAVLVAGRETGTKSATLVKLLIPPFATKASTVFLISAFSTDEEGYDGYFVAKIKAVGADGTVLEHLKKHIEISIPSGAPGIIPSWSSDGVRWYKLQKIYSEVKPTGIQGAYFVEKDGRIAIFTDHLMLFGFRKAQTPLTISSPVSAIEIQIGVSLSSRGGSGIGAMLFSTSTPTICAVSPAGVVTGLTKGKCLVTGFKSASGIYSDATSQELTILIHPTNSLATDAAKHFGNWLLCHEISYSIFVNSTTIQIDLCHHIVGKIAYLEVGTKSKNGSWKYKRVAKAVLDENGKAAYKLNSVIRNGQILRVIAESEVHYATIVSGK